MPAKAACSSCGKTVQRGKSSRPEITCQDCRRIEPKPYGSRTPMVPPRQCEALGCEVMYVPRPRSKDAPLQRFCSRSCAGRQPRSRQSRSRTCEICGKPYKRSYALQRTCGRACGVELRRRIYGYAGKSAPKPTPEPRTCQECVWCGQLFVGRTARTRACSRACGRKFNWAKSNAARSLRRAAEHTCPCGVMIQPTRHKCDDCLTAIRKLQRQHKKRAERARKRGARREPYTLAEIAARDRYRCGICIAAGRARQARVAMTKAVPHPSAPTIDHVLPLAEGGDDTRANVQLAHFDCNVRKHTGGSQQLAMIG